MMDPATLDAARNLLARAELSPDFEAVPMAGGNNRLWRLQGPDRSVVLK